MKQIIIHSDMGHEIGAAATAKLQGAKLLVVPRKDNKEDYEKEAANIVRNISFFNDNLEIMPFEIKDTVDEGWDFVKDLTGKQIEDDFWYEYAGVNLLPTENVAKLPLFEKLNALKEEGYIIIGVATGKTISDGKCGVTAQQQSLMFESFAGLKEIAKGRKVVFVNLQNFDKVNDLDKVAAFDEYFETVYTPGKTEYPELFGIRGVPHKMFYNLFCMLDMVVAIAGTHTWYAETMFPDLPMVTLYNTNGSENWAAKEWAYQSHGRQYYCLGYNEETDLKAYAEALKGTILAILGLSGN